MHVWVLSHNFPPEVNALANRTYEHAREWAASGHSFDVLTDVPHFPEGVVYSGYRNRFQHQQEDGISVYRVPIFPAENRGRIRRTLSYLSFLISLLVFSRRVPRRPDLIFASSPQIFTPLAGYLLSLWLRVPFVMEVRDLWPESIGAVGAIHNRWLLNAIQAVVDRLYRHARTIVVLTEAFREQIAGRGIEREKIVVVANGVSFADYDKPVEPTALEELARDYRLQGKFVVTYLGTVGMAHGVDLMLEAARRCTNPDVVFVVVGTGAARRDLERQLRDAPCPAFRLVSKQPRERMPLWRAVTDLSVVLLKDRPIFQTVVPSKLIEAMGARKPVVLGVRGESEALLRKAGAGVTFAPESVDELLAAVDQLVSNPEARRSCSELGYQYARQNHDRRALAAALWDHLERAGGTVSKPHPVP